MIRFSLGLALSLAVTAQGQTTVYRDPGGRFTLQLPATCSTFSPNGDMLQVSCGDGTLNLLQTGPGGPAGPALQNVERQYAGQWADFRRITGGASNDGRSVYATYTGRNPKGLNASLSLTAFDNGWVMMASAPQSSPSSRTLLDRIAATVRFGGATVTTTFGPEPTPTVSPTSTRNVGPVSPRVTPRVAPATNTNGPAPRFTHFRKVSVTDDPRYIGGEAFTFLAPADWHTQSSLEWHSGNLYYASDRTRISAPDGFSEIGAMPALNFEWAPAVAQFRGRTDMYPEVLPPVTGSSAILRSLVIPRYFPEARGARIVADEELPQPAAAFCEGFAKIGTQARYDCKAGKVRLEYEQGGTTVQQDIYAVAWYLYGDFDLVNWGVTYIRYSKAPKGKLEAQYTTFQTIFSSARVSLPWYNAYTQLNQQSMRASNDRMRMVRETMNHISNNMRESYENRIASEERIMEKWDNVIRGVDEFSDGSGSTVELPNTYDHTWTNGAGDYIQSNDANFNPNSVSRGSWTQIHPRH
jgi:hypothetical protein